jgi:hypothetical protein
MIALSLLLNPNTSALSKIKTDTCVSNADVSRAKHEQPKGYFFLDARETPIYKVFQPKSGASKMFG